MPTYKLDDFFRVARRKDPDTGKPLDPVLYEASGLIVANQSIGSGSRGGGYICVCDYCGHPVHTYNAHQKYCCVDCKKQDMKKNQKEEGFYVTKNKIRGRVSRKCETCGEIFYMRHSILPKGRGVYCCPDCYQKLKILRPQWFVCNNCGAPFKALSHANSKFCCLDCQNYAPKYDERGIYITYVPKLKESTNETRYFAEFNNEAIDIYEKILLENGYNQNLAGNQGVSSGNDGYCASFVFPKLPISLLLPIQERLMAKYRIQVF